MGLAVIPIWENALIVPFCAASCQCANMVNVPRGQNRSYTSYINVGGPAAENA